MSEADRSIEFADVRARARSVVVSGCAGMALAAATCDVIRDGPVSRLERKMVGGPRSLSVPWALVTELGDRPALAVMAATATAAALIRDRRSLMPLATVAAGMTLRWALARAVGRDRPAQERWIVDADGPSFPSRHATSTMLGALVLYRELPRSAALEGLLGLGVATVGLSRVRLGVHWPSDVVAGVALATLADAVVYGATNPRSGQVTTIGEPSVSSAARRTARSRQAGGRP